jgi:hypothetical protein
MPSATFPDWPATNDDSIQERVWLRDTVDLLGRLW